MTSPPHAPPHESRKPHDSHQPKRQISSGLITLIAVVLGVIVGVFTPQAAQWIPRGIGDLFVRSLKLIAPPLVLLSCMNALLGLGDMTRARRVGSRAACSGVHHSA